jgi:hypothetical protein
MKSDSIIDISYLVQNVAVVDSHSRFCIGRAEI